MVLFLKTHSKCTHPRKITFNSIQVKSSHLQFNIPSMTPRVVICSMVSTITSLYYAKSLNLKVGKFFTRYFILFRKNHCHKASLSTVSSAKQSLGNGRSLSGQDNPLKTPQEALCRASLILPHHGTSKLKSMEADSWPSLILILFHEPFPSG